MSRNSATLPPDYFEQLYSRDIDPWRFRSSAYEREKYAATIAALRGRRYGAALEVGCSIGVLSALLAPHCTTLTAIDASPTAIAEASASIAAPSNVSFDVRTVPDEFPDGRFDLIVLSEVLYYFSRPDLMRLAAKCLAAASPDGDLLLCHWLGETDYPLPGRDASELFAEAILTRMPHRTILRDETYRLERYSGTGPPAAGA